MGSRLLGGVHTTASLGDFLLARLSQKTLCYFDWSCILLYFILPFYLVGNRGLFNSLLAVLQSASFSPFILPLNTRDLYIYHVPDTSNAVYEVLKKRFDFGGDLIVASAVYRYNVLCLITLSENSCTNLFSAANITLGIGVLAGTYILKWINTKIHSTGIEYVFSPCVLKICIQ